MSKKREYKNALRNHLDDVKEMSGFPESGVITTQYTISSGEFHSVINDEISTRDGDGGTTVPIGGKFP